MGKPWAKYEIGFLRHAKFLALTPNAICLWLEAKSYCDENFNDGIFPRTALQTFRFASPKSVQALILSCGQKPSGQPYAPLWEAIDIGGVPHYRMHDYLEHNDCRDEVLERLQDADDKAELRRLANRDRQREARAKRKARLEVARHSDSHGDNRVTVTPTVTPNVTPRNAVTYGPTEAASATDPASASGSPSETTTAPPKRPIGAGSQQPLVVGHRIKVWRWQIEKVMQALGDQLDVFGPLDDWWQELDGRNDGVIRDNWAYIWASTLREAERRGCAFADTSVPGAPQNKRIAGLVAGGQAFLNRRQA